MQNLQWIKSTFYFLNTKHVDQHKKSCDNPPLLINDLKQSTNTKCVID